MLNIFWGRENYNKEKFIFENIKGQAMLLVPDQFTLQAERSAFFHVKKKGFMDDLSVVSLSGLGKKVLKETGGSRDVISKYGRYMLLSRIMIDRQNDLKIYRDQYRYPAFVEMMNDLISEMKQNCVSPEDVKHLLENCSRHGFLVQKMEDVYTVFSEYEKKINGKHIDSEDYLDIVAEKISLSEKLKEKEIWIHGFDNMTEKNLRIIRKLIKHCKNVNVVITCSKDVSDEKRGIFLSSSKMASKLKKAAEEENIKVGGSLIPEKYIIDEKSYPAGIIHLEKNIFSYPVKKSEECDGITLLQASDLYNEAESAAAYVLSLVRDKGERYRDISIICNDLETRGSILQRTFEEYGMNLFVDRKRSLIHNPAVRYILALLAIVINGYRTPEVLRVIKTGLTSLDHNDIQKLENYVYTFKIRGNMWKKEFVKNSEMFDADEVDSIEKNRKTIVETVENFKNSFVKGKTVGEKIRNIYVFLSENVHIQDKLEKLMRHQSENEFFDISGETAQAWNYMTSIFEQAVQLMGDEVVDDELLTEMLRTGFSSVEIGVLPPTADGLVVGTVQRTRNTGAKHIVVVGVNEGVLPVGFKNEGILTASEKKRLFDEDFEICNSDELRKQEEKLAMYRNLTGARDSLWMSYSASDIEGAELKPSLLFTHIKDMFPELKLKRDINNDPESGVQIQAAGPALKHMVEHFHAKDEMDPMWNSALVWYDENEIASLENVRTGLLYSNRQKRLESEDVRKLYAGYEGDLTVSPSALEMYSKCPFSFLMRYGMRLQERRIYEISGREIGDVYHEVLMKFAETLTEENLKVSSGNSRWTTIDRHESDELTDKIIDEIISRYREGLFRNGEEEKYRAKRLRRICRETTWAIVSDIRKNDIDTMIFEEKFGKGERIQPIEVSVNGESVFVHGKIDRVDYLEGDRIRVVDYKTGNESIKSSEVKKGWKLQLMLYLKAVSKSVAVNNAVGNAAENTYSQPLEETVENTNGNIERKPAGVYYFLIKEPSSDISDKKDENISKEIEKGIEKTLRMEGITVAETEKTSEKVMTDEMFSDFRKEFDELVEKLCAGIINGNIDIAPLKYDDNNACRYCEYDSICLYER